MRTRIGVGLVALAALVTGPRVSGQSPSFTIHILPGAVRAGRVDTVDIRLRITSLPDGGLALSAPMEVAGLKGIADRIVSLTASDADGAVPINVTDDLADSTGFGSSRHWRSGRPVRAPLEVAYHVVVAHPGPAAGPPFDLRTIAGGVSGAGLGFLALPDGDQSYSIRLRWDLSRVAPGAVAFSSLGDGDVDVIGTLDLLRLSWFMAGPARRYPATAAVNGFTAAWLGDPSFDAPALMAWSADAYRAIRVFFGDSVSPFRFFLRISPEQFASGGAALGNAFMLGLPVRHHAEAELRNTVAHETVHRFAQGIDGPPGTTSWFSEGLATWYARRIPFEAGLIPAAEFLDDLNGTAARYYSNPRRTIPNEQIPVEFWKDRNAQIVPYDRGSIYFATVDAGIRAKSKGVRGLDDVLLPLLARIRRGESVSAADWRDLMREELGDAGVALFDSVIVQGREIVAPSNAYGPCFARETITVGLFDLGFDELNSLRNSPRVITGLRRESSAGHAGLQDGDEVLTNDDLNDIRPRPEAILHLTVRRGRDTLQVQYLPRRDQVPAYRWKAQPCPGRP